jgi:PAS domain S-box-containing protein
LTENARRIEALYRMTERFYHAQSPEDIYDSALHAIITGLRCDRASILLHDDEDVMRFVAWAHLPEEYRRAAEGHSPWTTDACNPEPVPVSDFEHAELDPNLKAMILNEGIRAAAFIPLCVDGKLIGKFMAYFDTPHVFAEDEIELSLAIARHLAFAIQRRRTEDAMRANERRFRAMIDALPAAIYTTDAEGRLTHFNPAAVEFSGRVPELGSDRWYEGWRIFRADGEPWLPIDCPLAVSLREQRIIRSTEAIIERPDGTRRWFTPFPTPMLDEHGNVVGGINMLLDITERKEAELELREREQRFRAFLTATSDVIYSLNADWTEIRPLNGRDFVADLSAPSRAWLEKYVDPRDRAMVTTAVRKAIETMSPFEIEHRVIRADGTTGWTFSRTVPLFDTRGEITEWFGVARDITERKRSEEALAYQRRLYEAILTNTPDLAFVLDLDHRFIYANEGLLKMWGKTWDEAIGKTCLELGYEPWHAEMHDREIEQVIATKQPLRSEAPFTGTFGRRIYDYLFVPVIGANGEVEAVAGTTRDVTERREADQRKDEFLAMLAHELRNPLAPISNAIYMLRHDKPGSTLQQNAHAIIARQTAQLSRLVDDLLEVSRITTGRIQLRREWVLLSGIVESAVESVRSLIEQQGHALTVSMPDEPIWIYGDAARLEQILVNLLNNAAKYTPKGGQIDFHVEWADENVRISVKDTGIGIDPQWLPRVFDLFTQAERSLERSYGGLGVGLSLVKNLVEMHGGDVAARSEVGTGSEFVVRLPASRTSESKISIPSSETAVSPRLHILVVDDNVDAADTVAMLLQSHGHDAYTAYDGTAALEATSAYRPDAVLLDIGLPKLNGYQVAKRIRQNPALARTILIAMTGYGQTQDQKRSREAGFDAHLVKPVDFSSVERVLAELAAARASSSPAA